MSRFATEQTLTILIPPASGVGIRTYRRGFFHRRRYPVEIMRESALVYSLPIRRTGPNKRRAAVFGSARGAQ